MRFVGFFVKYKIQLDISGLLVYNIQLDSAVI